MGSYTIFTTHDISSASATNRPLEPKKRHLIDAEVGRRRGFKHLGCLAAGYMENLQRRNPHLHALICNLQRLSKSSRMQFGVDCPLHTVMNRS